MDDVSRQLQALLGRGATPDEVAYYNKFIQDEKITPHEIGLMIQNSPEYQGQALNRDVQGFQNTLQAQDQGYLQNAADIAGAQAQSRFAGLGRPNSSALAASVFGATGQAAQGLAQQRQSALANFYGQGLNQNRALSQSLGQGAMERGYGLRDDAKNFERQVDLTRIGNQYQQDLYSQYAKSQKKSALGGSIGGVAGALGGAALGSFAGPGGTMAGARLGGGLGQGFGGLF
jgi:hypothetical protein